MTTFSTNKKRSDLETSEEEEQFERPLGIKKLIKDKS